MMKIKNEELFAKKIQSLTDIIDYMKKTCLPTDKKKFAQLERTVLELVEQVEVVTIEPEAVMNNHIEALS